MQQQTSILQFGLAGLSLLLGLTAQIKVLEAAAALLFVAVPLLTWLILVIWHGEVRRMRRAGRFLADLEKVINHEIGDTRPSLTWETTLQLDIYPIRRLRSRYWAVFLLLISVALVSLGVGVARVTADEHASQLWFWIPLSALLVLAASSWYVYESYEEKQDRLRWRKERDSKVDSRIT